MANQEAMAEVFNQALFQGLRGSPDSQEQMLQCLVEFRYPPAILMLMALYKCSKRSVTSLDAKITVPVNDQIFFGVKEGRKEYMFAQALWKYYSSKGEQAEAIETLTSIAGNYAPAKLFLGYWCVDRNDLKTALQLFSESECAEGLYQEVILELKQWNKTSRKPFYFATSMSVSGEALKKFGPSSSKIRHLQRAAKMGHERAAGMINMLLLKKMHQEADDGKAEKTEGIIDSEDESESEEQDNSEDYYLHIDIKYDKFSSADRNKVSRKINKFMVESDCFDPRKLPNFPSDILKDEDSTKERIKIAVGHRAFTEFWKVRKHFSFGAFGDLVRTFKPGVEIKIVKIINNEHEYLTFVSSPVHGKIPNSEEVAVKAKVKKSSNANPPLKSTSITNLSTSAQSIEIPENTPKTMEKQS